MPEKSSNQPQTIEGLILSILTDEAQIVHCLREFFCKTLQEITAEKCLNPGKKAKASEDLIYAAAKKEAALAAVLEAIGKIIEEEPVEWITLVPGQSYPVMSQNPTISMVTFIAKTDIGVTGGKISAMFAGEEIGSTSNFDEIPMNYTITLSGQFDPDLVTLQNTGTVTVYIRNVTAS